MTETVAVPVRLQQQQQATLSATQKLTDAEALFLLRQLCRPRANEIGTLRLSPSGWKTWQTKLTMYAAAAFVAFASPT